MGAVATITSLLWFYIVFVQGKLTWEKIGIGNGTIAPEGRRDCAIGYDADRESLVLFGGRNSNGVLDDTWIFDLKNKTWTKLPQDKITGERFSVVYGVWRDGFYVATGEGSNGIFFNDIIHLDLATKKWRKLPQRGVIPETRYGAGGGIHPNGSALYVSHGFSGARYSNTFKYDLVKKEWYEVFDGTNSYNPSAPHARCLHGSVMATTDSFVMYGGCLSGGLTAGPCPADDGWRFTDGDDNLWTHLHDCPSPRMYPTMALLPGHFLNANKKKVKAAVLYGGNERSSALLKVEESVKGEVAVLDLDTNTWSRIKVEGAEVPENRQGAVMATGDAGIYMFGGAQLSDGLLSNEIWLLKGSDPSDNESAGDCGNKVFSLIMLHGIFMFIGWGVLAQAGAFIARYFRYRDPWWFKVHRILQGSSLLFSVAGLICAVQSVRFGHLMFLHGWLGVLIMVMGLQQPLNAFFRPHKSPDGSQTLKRRIWEYFHKILGRVVLVLALINISLGVFLAVTPFAAWLVWFLMLGAYCIAHIIMEVKLRMKMDSVATLEMEEVKT